VAFGVFEAWNQAGQVLIVLHRPQAANADAVWFYGNAHGSWEIAEVGVHLVIVAPHHNQFPGLVGRNYQTNF